MTSARRLVIGIGNPQRGDDGVGGLLAEQVGGRSVQQLTPELAAELAELEAVLFIDAWLAPAGAGPELIAIAPTKGATGSSAESHRLEPAQLLAISQALYGRAPTVHLLRVPADSFEHGTALSPELQAALPAARALLRQWLSGHA
ncbi:hydrogenase maturation protease [Cyanobium sp. FACHB-13342]|uniref:hydrogenase maturation protease n=1 Tax=Cyanobium sp. FACHB-13342 TaxID=2692793 RepID=UPI0016816AD6|nr:hydrogenase maturation protease [Cyanobium sp. FACHB-13342]MBD2422858.1 hydrogenase maturation protease [Cyanobium sp. FACHB-13342]